MRGNAHFCGAASIIVDEVLLIGYNLLLLVVLVLGAPFWLFRMATSGKYRAGLTARLGAVPRALREYIRGREVVWVHAVSVGEVIAISRFIAELRAALPQTAVVVSTTTLAGQRLARERFGAESVFYFPLDLTLVVRRYLKALRPAVLVLAETEFWPALLEECWCEAVPVAVINARISDRSLPRYKRFRGLCERVLAGVEIFLAQSEEDARRLLEIGAPPGHIHVGGNLKFDVRAAADNAVTRAVRAALPPETKVVVAGSTLEGEESALLAAWPQVLAAAPNTVLLLAPRHPERFETVARLLEASGIAWQRRSTWLRDGAAAAPLAQGSILLLDTIGELAGCYALGAVAFVGGSLVPAGGHNPLEPAQFGLPIVMGRSLENFRAIADEMLANEALLLTDAASLGEMLVSLLAHPEGAQAIGARAHAVFESQSGATTRSVDAVVALIDKKHSWEKQIAPAERKARA